MKEVSKGRILLEHKEPIKHLNPQIAGMDRKADMSHSQNSFYTAQ